MMLDPANVRALSASGRVFCLVATPEEVFERVTSDRRLASTGRCCRFPTRASGSSS